MAWRLKCAYYLVGATLISGAAHAQTSLTSPTYQPNPQPAQPQQQFGGYSNQAQPQQQFGAYSNQSPSVRTPPSTYYPGSPNYLPPQQPGYRYAPGYPPGYRPP
jgi:hypothetical protein